MDLNPNITRNISVVHKDRNSITSTEPTDKAVHSEQTLDVDNGMRIKGSHNTSSQEDLL